MLIVLILGGGIPDVIFFLSAYLYFLMVFTVSIYATYISYCHNKAT